MSGKDARDRQALGDGQPIAGGDAAGRMPGREASRPPLPKRFYATAGVGGDEGPPHPVLLDGRPVRTPKKQVLALPVRALAEAVAAEWAGQRGEIDPATMPLTRLVNTTLDGVIGQEDALRSDIAAYAMSDLLCYRAVGPADLVRRQAALWDPVLQWAEGRLGCRWVMAHGVMPVAQPEAVRGSVLGLLASHDAFRLAALHVITTLTGSALLTLALAEGRLDDEQVWAAAHVDEDFQIDAWGADGEAEARRAARRAEMTAASRLLALVPAS